MALKIVNTVPGDVTSALRPDEPIQAGLRDTTGNVILGNVGVRLAYTNLVHRSLLPESDTALAASGLVTTFTTTERRQPPSGAVVPTISGGSLHLPKTDNSDFNKCVYELEVPITPGRSAMGYLKFRLNMAWTLFSPDWCDQTDMAGPYFGLEYGPLNTAIYLFLRNSGFGGSLIYGGPLPAFGGARPGQTEYGFDWSSLADGSWMEFFFIFNFFENPYQVELWAKAEYDPTQFYLLGTSDILSLGNFPSSPSWMNARPGPTNFVRLFIGNAGRTGDLLVVDDWAIYPDFRQAVKQGLPVAGCERLVLPDSPSSYRASSNLAPDASVPGRWIAMVDPSPSMSYNPGQRSKAAYVNILKSGIVGFDGFRKEEPRLEQRVDGALIEAFMSVDEITSIGGAVGGGIGFEDGLKSYRLVAVRDLNAGRQSFGIVKDETNPESLSLGYHTTADDFDWTSLKLVRLVVDRHRDRLRAFCVDEDVPFMSMPLGAAIIPSPNDVKGRMLVGNLIFPSTSTRTKLSQLTYLNRYFAWEKEDLWIPSSLISPSAVRFVESVANDPDGSFQGGVTLNAGNVTDPNVVAYLNMNELSGNLTVPAGCSAAGTVFTAFGTPNYGVEAPLDLGTAITNSGDPGFSTGFGPPAVFKAGTSDFVTELWVKTPASTGAIIFKRGLSAGSDDIEVTYAGIDANGKPYFNAVQSIAPFNAYLAAASGACPDLRDGAWHKIVVAVTRASGVVFKVDGVTYPTTITTSTLALASDFNSSGPVNFLTISGFTVADLRLTIGNSTNDYGYSTVTGTDGAVRITKKAFDTVGSKRHFTIPVEMTDRNGILVDFRSHVEFYTGPTGRIFERKVDVGSGLTIYLGSKKVVLAFVDAGIHGRKIGIIPGSGSITDLIEQTPLGRAFSGSVDWTKMASYRLIVKPYESIQLWAGTILSDPLFTIPWLNETDGFDLPSDFSATSLDFGHFGENPSSTTNWEHIRWGTSNGYDLSVRQEFPNGIGKTVFGGKIFTMTDFS